MIFQGPVMKGMRLHILLHIALKKVFYSFQLRIWQNIRVFIIRITRKYHAQNFVNYCIV